VLEQAGKEILCTTDTYGEVSRSFQGRELTLVGPPDLPDPPDCHVRKEFDQPQRLGIAHHVQYRCARRPGWLDGHKDGRAHAEHWMRFADGRDADSVSLVSMVDFAPPAVLEIGEFSTITVELSVHVRARPAPGWLACRVFTKHVSGDL